MRYTSYHRTTHIQYYTLYSVYNITIYTAYSDLPSNYEPLNEYGITLRSIPSRILYIMIYDDAMSYILA